MGLVKMLAAYFCLVLFISQIIESKTIVEENDENDKLAKETLQDLEAAAKPQNEPRNLLQVKTTSNMNKYLNNAGYKKHGEDYRRTILSQL